MNLAPVQSSSIAAVGYAAEANLLVVEFRRGARYQYFAVPAATFSAFLAAVSKGTFFHQHIRGRYPYRRVGATT